MRHTDKHRRYRKQLRRHASYAEQLLWFVLRSKQTGYKFRRQHSIGNYIVDFYCPSLRLVVELDGPTHDGLRAEQKDQLRTEFLQRQGCTVVRYSVEQVYEDRDAVATDIKKHCDNFTASSPPYEKGGARGG